METTKSSIIIIVFQVIIITSFFLTCFIAVIIYFRNRRNNHILENAQLKEKFQQQLILSQVEIQESTFATIGRELHDNVGQILSSAKMMLGITERKLSEPPETLKFAIDAVGNAIEEIRSLSKVLDTEWLKNFEFTINLNREIERINRTNDKLRVELHNLKSISLVPDKQLLLFRIVQETMNNAIKHAKATIITINIETNVKENILEISVKDNGKGFNTSNIAQSGVGINNIKQRVGLLEGQINWTSEIGKGTTVFIKLPI